MVTGRNRRACLGQFALHLEVRSGSAWIMERAIPYDDIHAIYRYDARDWPFLLRALAAWTGIALLLVLVGALASWPGWFRLASLGLATLLAVAVSIYRVACVPRPTIRIAGPDRRVDLLATRAGFFEALAARLQA